MVRFYGGRKITRESILNEEVEGKKTKAFKYVNTFEIIIFQIFYRGKQGSFSRAFYANTSVVNAVSAKSFSVLQRDI